MTPRRSLGPARFALALAALVLAAAGALTPGAAVAQQPPGDDLPIEVNATLSPGQANIGDRVILTIDVTHADDVLVTAAPPAPGANLELRETRPAETVYDDAGGAVTTFSWVYQPFNLGVLRPGDVRISWLFEDGSGGNAVVRPPGLEVAAVRAPTDGELRPLKPQATVAGAPAAWERPALIGGIALAALATGALTVLAWTRRRRDDDVIEVPDTAPEERARRALDAMAARDPIGQGDYEEYYGTISIVVRAYIEERYGFRATALTSPQLERRMARQGVERWQARLVSGLLMRCDAAVYAHRYPDPASADHDLTAAYEIIELSRPRELVAVGAA